jgi:hypothetical protein
VTRVRDSIPLNDFQLLIAAVQSADDAKIESAVVAIAGAVKSTTKPSTRRTRGKESRS